MEDQILNIKEDITIKSHNDFKNLFDTNSPKIPILEQILNDNENTIIITPYENNRLEIIGCLCDLINRNTKTDLYNNVEDIIYSTAKKIIIPSPNIKEVIKIFEYLISDSRSYIFSMNIKTFDNVLESMKILISMQLPNLTNKSIEHMLHISNANLVFINKNEKGLYEIDHIAQIIYEDGRLILLDKISKEIENNIIPDKTTFEEEIQEINTQNAEETYKEEAEKEIKEIEDNQIQEEEKEITPKKINKYKLLKEKIKNKKLL